MCILGEKRMLFNWTKSQCNYSTRGLGIYSKPPRIRKLSYMEIILRIFIRRTRKVISIRIAKLRNYG